MSWDTNSTTCTANISISYNLTSCTTATTGMWMQETYTSGNGVFSYGGQRVFDPAQVAALRQDFRDVKEDRRRKKAELKARRLFKRTVGDVAYERFKTKGYHEIYGASRQRYRLVPGRWVRVMGEGEEVLHELCAHLPFGVPWFDTMAVQHLMLTCCKDTEDKFKAIANKHTAGIYPIDEMAA